MGAETTGGAQWSRANSGPGRHCQRPPNWLYRFRELDKPTELWDAHTLAYATDMAGLRVTDRRAVTGPPRRWVEMAEDSPPLP